MVTKSIKIQKLCYLCGTITSEKSQDHCPPAQFFPSSLRKKHNLSVLTTLPTHEKCNKKFSFDEEYFFVSLGCLVEDDYVRKSILEDLKKRFKTPRRQALYHTVKKEFTDKTATGIYFPNGKMGKKVDLERIENVIWKIVRGIYFLEKEKILPESSKKYIRMMDPQQNHPTVTKDLFEKVKAQKERGKYGWLFSYKILESNPPGIYAIGFRFWKQIMFLITFHDSECPCEDCVIPAP